MYLIDYGLGRNRRMLGDILVEGGKQSPLNVLAERPNYGNENGQSISGRWFLLRMAR